ncbi:MAG: lipopolysaccharide heptosyltransferase II [Deltaproteobacteria bacterium]
MKVSGKLPVDKSTVRRILIRATNWVGDVVMSMPALEAVRHNFPSGTIHVLARPWVVSLFENHPAVDHVMLLNKDKGYPRDVLEILRVAKAIRRHQFDLAILFQNAFEAALLAYLGRARLRVGYNTDGRSLLLTHAVKRSEEVLSSHQVEYYLAILKAMDWAAPTTEPRVFVSEKDRQSVGALLSEKGINQGDHLLGLSPGAVYGPAKRWPVERFAAIGDWAVDRWNIKALVVGSRAEDELCQALAGTMKQQSLNLCGITTLGEVMALIERCRFFVCNDSGLMHVAGALNVPTVAIFGSTDPVATGPRGEYTRIVRHPMDCSPCLKPQCDFGYPCLLAIEPQEVWAEMESLKRMVA